MNVFAVMDAYGFTCGDDNSDCNLARRAIAELIESARFANEYLGGFEVAAGMQNAVYMTPQARLRQQADEMDRKEATIRRFRNALRGVQ